MNSLQRPSRDRGCDVGERHIGKPRLPGRLREKAAVKAGDKTVSGQACGDYRKCFPGERDVLFRMKALVLSGLLFTNPGKYVKRLRKHSACAIMREAVRNSFPGTGTGRKRCIPSIHCIKDHQAVIRAGQIYPNKDMSVRPL